MVTDPTLASLATVAGAAAVVSIVLQIILTAMALPDAMQTRWGPLMALALGIIFVVGAALVTGSQDGASLGQAALTGLFAGATAMGLHNLVTKTGGSFVSPPSK